MNDDVFLEMQRLCEVASLRARANRVENGGSSMGAPTWPYDSLDQEALAYFAEDVQIRGTVATLRKNGVVLRIDFARNRWRLAGPCKTPTVVSGIIYALCDFCSGHEAAVLERLKRLWERRGLLRGSPPARRKKANRPARLPALPSASETF